MTRSVVAPVMALIGLVVMLPHNLYQMSRWIMGLAVASKPASSNAAFNAATRSLTPPCGSPMTSPRPIWLCALPGSLTDAAACTTQPITWPIGRCAAIVPPGSTLFNARPAAGPGRPWQNHQGTPFIAGTISVCGPSSGAMARATSASAGAFTAITTTSCTPSAAGSALAVAGPEIGPAKPSMRNPCSASAASVAPRATALTWCRPVAARRAPISRPMAPAP